MRLLAIDPGPEESAYVLYDTDTRMPVVWAKVNNFEVRDVLAHHVFLAHPVAIEVIASYGMAVGAEVFSTCEWIGCFTEVSRGSRLVPYRVYRRDVKMFLCGSVKAKDTNVRQALIDRYGPGKDRAIGRKATPGPLYGLTADCWAALGVAVTCAETQLNPIVQDIAA